MATIEEHLANLVSEVEFTRAMALDALRSDALHDERPTAQSAGVAARVVPLVLVPTIPERDRLIEFLADLAVHDALAPQLASHAGALAALLTDDSVRVRLAVLPLLSRLRGGVHETTAPLQRAALEDEEQRVRLGALLALATMGADIAALANGLYAHEPDELDRFVAALALLLGEQAVSRDVLEFALSSLRVRKLLLRCGDVPLVDNPRARLATAMARHPDAALRELALARELEHLGDEAWLDDATADAVLRLGQACGGRSNLRAVHLVATRVFGPNGSLDLIEVLERFGLPVDPVVLQGQLGAEFPIGLPQQRVARAKRPWWRFW